MCAVRATTRVPETALVPETRRSNYGRLKNSAHNMKAFQPDEVVVPAGSTFACEIDDRVLAWKEVTADKMVVRTTKRFSSLLNDSSWTGCLPDITHEAENIQTFSYFPSEAGSRFLEIRDPFGKLLGFRFPIGNETITTLRSHGDVGLIFWVWACLFVVFVCMFGVTRREK